MQVHVFKTNVQYPVYADKVLRHVKELDGVMRCNFDLTDCDHILRVETNIVPPTAVIARVKLAGFDCEELGD